MSTPSDAAATILLVESRRERRERVEASLSDAPGVVLDAVEGVAAALDALAAEDCDVECVLTAHDLPDGDGPELLERVRAKHPHLPVVLFPADGSEALASRAIAAGASDYVAPETLGDTEELDDGEGAGEAYDGLGERLREHVDVWREARAGSESDRRFRTLVESLPGIAYRAGTGDSWPFEYVEGECEATTGYTAAELCEEVDWERDVIHPEDREEIREQVEGALDAGESFEGTYRIETADGETRWLWECGREVDDGVLEGFITDVTDSRSCERELHETDELLGAVVEASPAAIVAIDLDDEVELWNPAAERIFGWSAEEVLGEQLPFVPDDQAEEHATFCDRLEAGDPLTGVETRRVRKDGEPIDVNLNVAPIRGTDGDVVGCMGAILDVTGRKERDRELERTKELLNSAERMGDVGAWEWNVETDELTWSQGLRRILGVSDDFEPTFGTLLEFVHPEDREHYREHLERCRESGHFESQTYRIVTAGGRERWVSCEGAPVERDDGTTVIRGFTHDVTERKHRDHQVAVLDRVLRHTLRNDVGEIVDRAETIAERTDGAAADSASAIVERGTELRTLANKHREVAKLLSEPQSVHEYDVRRMLERVVDQMRETYPGAEIDCACPPPVEVVATSEVEAAVAELVENGVEHSDADVPTVEVDAEIEEDAVELRIADNGPGLPERERETIRRAGDVDPLDSGGGMGLWLAKWIVSRSGGTLRFADSEPRGTEVRIRLPRTSVEPARGSTGSGTEQQSEP